MRVSSMSWGCHTRTSFGDRRLFGLAKVSPTKSALPTSDEHSEASAYAAIADRRQKFVFYPG